MSTTAQETARATAERAMQANTSPRYMRLRTVKAYVAGTQYDGRKSFWDDSVELLQRAPCIVYTMVAKAIQSHGGMVLGESRFPRFTTHADEQDPEQDEQGLGLAKDDSAVLDPFIARLCKHAKLHLVARAALGQAMGCGTAVAIACARAGRLEVDTTPAEWCTPTFDPQHPGVVTKLEIRYPYLSEVKNAEGVTVTTCLIYRRVIDTERDVTYEPAVASPDGIEPKWKEAQAYDHGLGFCPVHWYRFMKGAATPAEIDGDAIHSQLLDELYALDLARSQVHRATLSTLDPIMTEIGVDPNEQPALLVDPSSPYAAAGGNVMANQATFERQWRPVGGKVGKARKRAPGMVYSYENPNAKVELLTLPGDAMDAGHKNVASLERMLCEALHWLPLDPESMKHSALSGRALEQLYKRQIDYDNDVRTDFGQGWLLPMVDMLLRITRKIVQSGRGLYLRGGAKVVALLDRFEIAPEAGEGALPFWSRPEIDIVWPLYFAPTEIDQKAIGDNVRADLEAQIITKRTAVEKLATWYAIDDVDAYVDTLDAEEGEHEHAVAEASARLTVGDGPAAGGPLAPPPPPTGARATAAPAAAPMKGMPSAARRLAPGRLLRRGSPPAGASA